MSDVSLADRREGGSRVQHAMQAVTDHIRVQGLRVGDSLPGEAFFSASLGVSRPVMREAFGALAALRLIDVGNGRKPRVAAMDGSVFATSLDHAISTAQIGVPDVWEVRRTIEQRTAALAAVQRSEAEAAGILALAEAMAASEADLEQLTDHDIAFHEAIARASHNPLFVQIVASFRHLMTVAVPAAWGTRVALTHRQLMIERHRAVAAAIAAKDPVAAAAAMDDHFDTSIGDILKGMSDRKG
ncbi:FCD domain-containing protein [Caulobacter sp. 17J65-9]|uniref:FadR/GntR family transcriptional regulator n=1 Tax=Caulobacter sp. 17J65-9 TaxID=2709382 RepID=UPI0013C803F7|nr:FCD domain-containing protein [Caulobacter sp. 17J65-9]NEX93443.1 FadR family transcriptional regulator [Caulobacter sp. 17J65-9]